MPTPPSCRIAAVMPDMAESAIACRKLDLLLKVGLLKWGQVGRRSRLGSSTSTRDTEKINFTVLAAYVILAVAAELFQLL